MSSATGCSEESAPASLAASRTTAARSSGRARRLAPGVGAGEQQQVADQAAHAPRGAQRRLGHLALLALELALQQLEVREDAGQRRAQLVRGVGDEVALAVERRLRLLAGRAQLAEHGLERGGEVGDLVVGARLGSLMSVSRVRATSRAARVSPAIGRIARAAT